MALIILQDTTNQTTPSPVNTSYSSIGATRPHFYNTRHCVKIHGACFFNDTLNGKSLEYRKLIKKPIYKKVWNNPMRNEIGRLAQGN